MPAMASETTDRAQERQARAEARAAALGAAAGVATAALVGFAKANDMTKTELLEWVGKKWDSFDETKAKMGSIFEDLARSVGMHDEQQ